MKKKIVTICSSVTFYPQVIEIEKDLRKLGFQVKIPKTARKWLKDPNRDPEAEKVWFKDSSKYILKRRLMDDHFKKVKEGDIILVLNYKKKGLEGYIGGNVLMEMLVAYLFKKKIYILNPIDEKLSFAEEVFGLQPVFLNGDLKKIK